MTKLTWDQLVRLPLGARVVFTEPYDIFPTCVVMGGEKATITHASIAFEASDGIDTVISVLPDNMGLRTMLKEWHGRIHLSPRSPDDVDLSPVALDGSLLDQAVRSSDIVLAGHMLGNALGLVASDINALEDWAAVWSQMDPNDRVRSLALWLRHVLAGLPAPRSPHLAREPQPTLHRRAVELSRAVAADPRAERDPVWRALFDDARRLAARIHNLDEQPTFNEFLDKLMKAAGFTAHNTGGGCMAWRKERDDHHVLITVGDSGLYANPDHAVWMAGIYSSAEHGEVREDITLADAIKWADDALTNPDLYLKGDMRLGGRL